MLKNIEVLAPAGDMSSLEAAINAGADAVYLGLDNFNARVKAENFHEDNIRDVVKRAHLFGIKVYVALNTLVSDSEFEKLMKVVDVAYKSKVDAFIIQDLGVARFLKLRYKNIVLHASTQMGINNLYGALVAEKLGFKRVVLSRETSIEDIRLIKEKTSLEIEFFVQGALCVAFSGNCYYSSLKHNKSGNRGLCLQLCRLKYNAEYDGNNMGNKYYLSPKDLCLFNNMKELIDAGVCSFKIEGRLRRPGYVSQAVKSVKNVIRNISDESNIKTEINNMKKVFVRGDGFNENAYLFGNNENLIDKRFNNHVGVEVGAVISVKPFKNLYEIIIESKYQLNKNDGLKFFYKDEEVSLGIGSVEKIGNKLYKIISKSKPKVSSVVYLTMQSKFEEGLLSDKRKLLLDLKIKIEAGKEAVVEVKCDSYKFLVKSEIVFEKAKTIGVRKEQVEEKFAKMVDSNFSINSIAVDIIGDVYVSFSQLNNFKNQVVSSVEKQILKEKEGGFNLEIVENIMPQNIQMKISFKTNLNIFVINNVSQLNNFNICRNDIVFYFPKDYKNIDVKIFDDIKSKYKCFVGLKLPALANFKDIELIDDFLLKYKNKELFILADNIYGINYISKGYNVLANYTMNIYNSLTAEVLSDLGVYSAVKTIEYVEGGIKENELISYVYGRVNLMLFAHCPYKNVFDNTCENCKAGKTLFYENNSKKYEIYKYKISKCYFYLKDDFVYNKKISNTKCMFDLT